MIMSMGFERNHVIAALKATENNLDRALDWIMSHGPEELSTNKMETSDSSVPKYRDGRGSEFKIIYFYFKYLVYTRSIFICIIKY